MMAAQWREWLQEAQIMETQEQINKAHHEAEAERAHARRDRWADRVDWLLAELNEAMEREGGQP